MTSEEKEILTTAVLTISDPRGNWEHGWRSICQLIGLDVENHRAQFRKRSDEELRHLAAPGATLKLPPLSPASERF